MKTFVAIALFFSASAASAGLSKFDCSRRYTPVQIQAIIDRLDDSQRLIIADSCLEQARELEREVDSIVGKGNGAVKFRLTVRAMICDLQSNQFRFGRRTGL